MDKVGIKAVLFFLFSLCGWSQEFEVRLKTASDLKPLYLFMQGGGSSHAKELYAALSFDLNAGSFLTVLPSRVEWDAALKQPFDVSFWKRENIPFVFLMTLSKDTLQLQAYDIERGISKRYLPGSLTGRLEEDLKLVHKLSDVLHKDLFGVEGIASLRWIYSERTQGSSPSEWFSEIWISDYDGANRRQVTSGNGYCVTPGFYPHTAGLPNPPFFFVSHHLGQSKIYASFPGTIKPEIAIALRGSQLLPALNAAGTHMAFISDAAGRPDLFLQSWQGGKGRGKSRQLFSCPRATQASPTFNPEGTELAFVSDKDGSPRIYRLPLPSSRQRNRPEPELLTKRNRENTSPSWSPDGQKLAFSAKVDGIRQIWIYDFLSGEEYPLTTGPENKENPAWAPDSLHLVYNTEGPVEGQLFLIDLRQKSPLLITQGPGQKRFASWETR